MAHGIVTMTLDLSKLHSERPGGGGIYVDTVEEMRTRARKHCAQHANPWSNAPWQTEPHPVWTVEDNGDSIILTIPPEMFWDSDIWEEARYFQSIGVRVDCPFLKGKPFFD